MRHHFHIGNRLSRVLVSKSAIRRVSHTQYHDFMLDKARNPVQYRHYLREILASRDLDQEWLAGRLNCEPGTISKLISGGMRLSDKWIYQIADALGIGPGAIFRDPHQPSVDSILDAVPQKKRDEIIRVIKAMTEAA